MIAPLWRQLCGSFGSDLRHGWPENAWMHIPGQTWAIQDKFHTTSSHERAVRAVDLALRKQDAIERLAPKLAQRRGYLAALVARTKQ